MRLVVIELSGGQQVATYEFNKEQIKIGRDPDQCDLVFAQEKWLMVSRVHAVLRVQGNAVYLTDAKSRQGTYLNGDRIASEREVSKGSRIQFGESGPTVTVELTTISANARSVTPPSDAAFDPTIREGNLSPHVTAEPNSASSDKTQAELIVESGVTANGQTRFLLTAERTVLGREAPADIKVEAVAQVVSRRHAEITRQKDGSYIVADLQSFNGTLVNGHRVTAPTGIKHGDLIQLSVGGPILRFAQAANAVTNNRLGSAALPTGAKSPAPVAQRSSKEAARPTNLKAQTIVVMPGVSQGEWAGSPERAKAQLLTHCGFDSTGRISIGRAADNNIRLDVFLISNHHALFINTAQGVVIQDAGSTNGVYLNGARVVGWQYVTPEDVVQIGPFVITVDRTLGVTVFDTRALTKVEAYEITDVLNRSGREIKLLDNISIEIEPNEFIGLLGPSGAGKSLLMNALNGMGRPTSGQVLVNNLDLYQHLHSLKHSIGHVPQDDIIHQELTVYQTLYYVARLRLSRDLNRSEVDQIVSEVLELTNLSERRDVKVSQLSGGQRKRVSIAVELITKPSIIFLDEPTSGLDPATEEKIMKLFRQIAESGRTVILTTHAMENVHLFDKVAVLLRGKLIFYGTPQEALDFVGARNFIELYNKLERSLDVDVDQLEPLPKNAPAVQKREFDERRNQIANENAEGWRNRYLQSEVYKRNTPGLVSQGYQIQQFAAPQVRRTGILGSLRQWITLVQRYLTVLFNDKLNLAILLCQAPIISLMTYLVVDSNDPRDFAYFVMAIVPVWFGTSVAAREIVKEGSIYRRERMVNLGIFPYLGSKLFSLALIVTLQCVFMFALLKLLHFAGLMYLPGLFFGMGQLLLMILTGMVGIALGLFVSSVVKTSEVATSIVPLLLIPQILFCGLVGVPRGATRVLGTVMPVTWSFDGMKRLSTLDTLKAEGSDQTGENAGQGVYKHLEETNEKNFADTRQRIEAQRKQTEDELKEYDRKLREYVASLSTPRPTGARTAPDLPTPKPVPSFPKIEKLNDDLSHYVTFKHPWGNVILDPLVLVAMFCILIVMTLIALRLKDVTSRTR